MSSSGNNYPLRNGKHSLHEGGMKTLSIYYNPKLDPSTRGTERDFLMHTTDWFTTMLDMTGQPFDSDYSKKVAFFLNNLLILNLDM